MSEESEDEIRERLFQPKRQDLSVSEGVEAMRNAGRSEMEISEWIHDKVRRRFGFRTKGE
mgnify:FL=1